MKRGKVIFRADGNAQIGLGHVVRSLALADMLREDFDVLFCIRNPIPTLKTQILDVCEGIIELPETDNDLEEARKFVADYLTGNEIVVLDGYHFVTQYQQIIKDKGNKLVCIDDIHAYHFVADVVINHAGGITPRDYSAEAYTQFCLGLKYALLRKPFLEAAKDRNYANREKGSVFISLGGADPNNHTLEVLKECEDIAALKKCYLVIGGAYKQKEILNKYLQTSSLKVELLSNLSAEEMVDYMKRCEMAITPPSTVAIEYLSVGGQLFLKKTAENQTALQTFLLSHKIAEIFSAPCVLDGSDIEFSLATKPVDGKQSKRLLRMFYTLALNPRKARKNDVMLYYNWANDPSTREHSFSKELIPLDEHIRWFSKKIISPSSTIYTMELYNKPIGQIRFDITNKDSSAVISFSLGKEYRGRGLGESILRAGVAQFIKEYGPSYSIIGYVKKSNIASIKAFRSIHAHEQETKDYENSYKYTVS